MGDTLVVLLVQPLPGHQTGSHQSGVFPQPGQELSIDVLLEAQSLVAINKLCVFQHFGMLAAFRWRGLRTVKKKKVVSLLIYNVNNPLYEQLYNNTVISLHYENRISPHLQTGWVQKSLC